MLVQRSIPTRFDMMALTSGKMHIHDMLSCIPSISFEDFSIQFDSIELELDQYFK